MFSSALILAVAVAVETVHPTEDLVIAERVLAPTADESADRAADIQAALDEVGGLGGGTVFLKAGRYAVRKPIVLPYGVVLRGDYAAGRPAASTVLAVMGGRGEDEDAPAAFTVRSGAGLVGLVFWYPDQKFDEIVPYPWTVRSQRRGVNWNNANCQTVSDCTFANAYLGIAFGPEINEQHLLRRVRMTALKTGFFNDTCTDTGRIYETTVSPSVWATSGFENAPDESALKEWLKAHDAVGVRLLRTDWEHVWRLRVDGYAVGLELDRGVEGMGIENFADCDFTDCAVALFAGQVAPCGIKFYDCRLAGDKETVRFGLFNGRLYFHSCVFSGAPLPAQSCISVVPRERVPICHKAQAPQVSFGNQPLYLAQEYGVSPQAEDNGSALAKALAVAGKTGGTVYVPAGFYRFRSNVVVPAGVELRGASDVPLHTFSGGTVFEPYQGRGDGNGEPFVSLEPKASVRGLTIWYPEQNPIEPEPFPWGVRSLGPECRVIDVTFGNAWQGVDFMTNDSTGHFLSGIGGAFFRRGIFVGNAKSGTVEDVQMNPHCVWKRRSGYPDIRIPAEAKDVTDKGQLLIAYQRKNLEAMVFRDCADEYVRGTLVYAGKDGLAAYGRNRLDVLLHNSDTCVRGVLVEQEKGSVLRVAQQILTPYCEPGWGIPSAGIYLTEKDAGDSYFVGACLWCPNPTLSQNGRGRVALEQYGTMSGPVIANGGRAVVREGHHLASLPYQVVVSNGTASVRNGSNASGAFKVWDPKNRAKVSGSSFTPMSDRFKPAHPLRKVFALDCEPRSPVKAIENTIDSVNGTCKDVDSWFCRVEAEKDGNRVLHVRGRPLHPSYSCFYAQVANPDMVVYPDTVLSYRFKPLNERALGMWVDTGYAFGLPGRDSGCGGIGDARPKVGEWCSCRVPLAACAGKVLVSLMLRYESGGNGRDCFDALFDDIRVETGSICEDLGAKAVLNDGVVTMVPPCRRPVYYRTDGGTVTETSPTFSGSLKLPVGTTEFRWSPSMDTGRPSDYEFPLTVSK